MIANLFKRNTQPQKTPNTAPEKKAGLFKRLRDGLSKTRKAFTEGISQLILGKKTIDDALLEELESLLITADVGVETTAYFIDRLTDALERKALQSPEKLLEMLNELCTDLLTPVEAPLKISKQNGPFIVLMVGVNGAGKTTTIGKLAQRFKQDGYSVGLAAGDTFRAAAVEQLQAWGTQQGVPVFAQESGADSASVIFDAISTAKKRGLDILIADTAGRLQNKQNLMNELVKVVKVIRKFDEQAPHEIMLVVDACNGYNALSQAQQFNDSVGLTGITITKLDGTAKGGMIFPIAHQLGIPIRYIGAGEQADDLRVFEAKAFVDALLSQ